MIKFFVDSFQVKKIYDLRETKGIKVFFYFLLLVLIISFPLNLQIIRSGGWDLYNFTSGIRESYPDWLPYDLPEDIEISASGMYYEDTQNTVFMTTNIDGDDLYIVISPLADYEPVDRTLVFEKDGISYYDQDGVYMFATDYSKVEGVIRFYDLKLGTQSSAVDKFSSIIENSFGGYAQFKSIIYNVLINLVLNILLVVIVSFLFIFIRIKYQKVTTFWDNIKIVISSMTIPALLGMIVGILGVMELSAFTVVIFQFATPIIAYVAIYRGSKLKDTNNKYI
ncbi:MAG: DUF1189 family protein [Bacilli bacterium]|nr:DUF1189 family protein [Bacilli bacterium]